MNPDVLREIIENGGVPYKEGAVSFIFTCPRCSKPRKLYLRKKDGRFICFVCSGKGDGFKGKGEYALAEIYNTTLESIRNKLYGWEAENLSNLIELKLVNPYDDEESPWEDLEEELPEIEYPFNFISPLSNKDGLNYLNGRGIFEEQIKEYGIRFNFKWRTVVFPVIVNGRLVGWQERSINSNFKYTLKGFNKEHVLMFQDRLIGSGHAVLCEGPVDGIKAHLCGGNVVSMGKGVSENQLRIIKGSVRKLYLALDPDAFTEIDSICRKLSQEIDIYLLFPPKNKKDLGECSYEEVFEQFKTAPKWCGQMYLNFKV